jgi:hypothetical protein
MGLLARRQFWILGLVTIVAGLLAGCVATSVSSRVVTPQQSSVQRVAVVVNSGTFERGIAGHLGQRNFNNLSPNLAARLPVVFSLNGLPARSVPLEEGGNTTVHAEAGETVMIISPQSASYSTGSGQTLIIRATLQNPGANGLFWRADIDMRTLGFGSFDDKLADDIAVKLLERMRTDRIATLADGPFRSK